MQGVWRAWFAALGLGMAPAAGVLVAGRPGSLAAGVLLAGSLAAIPGLAALKSTAEAEQFVRGMRRSCGRVHVVRDQLDWSLRRRLVVETPVGPWRIRGVLASLRHGIVVKPPEARGIYKVCEDPSEAGRVLMARVLTARPALAENLSMTAEPESPRQAARARGS